MTSWARLTRHGDDRLLSAENNARARVRHGGELPALDEPSADIERGKMGIAMEVFTADEMDPGIALVWDLTRYGRIEHSASLPRDIGRGARRYTFQDPRQAGR